MLGIIILSTFFNVIYAADLNGTIINLAPWGYINKAGKVDGIHKNILDAISVRTGLTINYELRPLARFVIEVEKGQTDFGMLIMREKFRPYVDEIHQIQDLSQYLLYAKGLSESQIKSPKSIVILREDLSIPIEDLAAFEIDLNKQKPYLVTSYTQAFKMLQLKRVDVAIFTQGAFAEFLKNSNFERSDFGSIKLLHKKQASFFMPKNAKGYTKKRAEIIRIALRSLWRDGTIEQINNHAMNQ